jgi:hypothetical protein
MPDPILKIRLPKTTKVDDRPGVNVISARMVAMPNRMPLATAYNTSDCSSG